MTGAKSIRKLAAELLAGIERKKERAGPEGPAKFSEGCNEPDAHNHFRRGARDAAGRETVYIHEPPAISRSATSIPIRISGQPIKRAPT